MKNFRFLLPLLLLFLFTATANADSTVTLIPGQPCVVFTCDGVLLTLTGEMQQSPTGISILAIAENETDHTLRVRYQGSCNGWSIPRADVVPQSGTISKQSKAKGRLLLDTGLLEIHSREEIMTLSLDFIMEDADTGAELFREEDVHLYFASSQANRPTFYEECPLLPELNCITDIGQSKALRISIPMGSNYCLATYRYARPDDPDVLHQILGCYTGALTQKGLDVARHDDTLIISAGSVRLARLDVLDDTLTMTLTSATRELTQEMLASPAGNTPVFNAYGDKVVTFGDTIELSDCTIHLDKNGCSSTFPTSINIWTNRPASEEKPSDRNCWFVYADATLTNTGDAPLTLSGIYTHCELEDGTFCTTKIRKVCIGLDDPANEVLPGQSSTITIAAEVPTDKLRVPATIRFGFSQFPRIFLKEDSRWMNFDYCYDSYAITLPVK